MPINNLYFPTIFAAVVTCLLTSLLLFARRKEGERSRVILAFIILLSVFNYSLRFVAMLQGEYPSSVVSVPMLLLAIFTVTSYILYPIEVISPGWLNFKQGLGLYIPVMVLTAIWLITCSLGVDYAPYDSLLEMLSHLGQFDVWFRLMLCLLAFCPLLSIFFIPYAKKYSNINHTWVSTYATLFFINSTSYLLVLMFENSITDTLYYYVSVGCNLYFAYVELFERQIGRALTSTEYTQENLTSAIPLCTKPIPPLSMASARESALFEKMDTYIKTQHAWRNPDLSMGDLVKAACTNRTSLSQAIRRQGYENYADYVNRMRIDEFIHIVSEGKAENFQMAFFDVGFRSRATAQRNFRQVTGTSPSQYFCQSQKPDEAAFPK